MSRTRASPGFATSAAAEVAGRTAARGLTVSEWLVTAGSEDRPQPERAREQTHPSTTTVFQAFLLHVSPVGLLLRQLRAFLKMSG
ncbi:MAG: hypothetical protein QM756_38665 [Polyangiaceae bacterium]